MGLVPYINLVTLTCFWLNSVKGEEHHGLVSCILRRYGGLCKLGTLILLLITSCGM